jgi:hypothetical protein
MIKLVKNHNDPPEIEPVTFHIVPMCLNQLRFLLVNCKIRKEISHFYTTKISLILFTGPLIASVFQSMSASLTSRLISLRSILILSPHLHIFTRSGAFTSGIHGNIYMLISYLSYVLQLHSISSSIQPTVLLHPLCIGQLFPETFDKQLWLYFQRAESFSLFSPFEKKTAILKFKMPFWSLKLRQQWEISFYSFVIWCQELQDKFIRFSYGMETSRNHSKEKSDFVEITCIEFYANQIKYLENNRKYYLHKNVNYINFN